MNMPPVCKGNERLTDMPLQEQSGAYLEELRYIAALPYKLKIITSKCMWVKCPKKQEVHYSKLHKALRYTTASYMH